MPLKHEWIQFPALHQHEHEYNTLFQDYSFLTLLRWKTHQNLAIFLLDNERSDDDDIIAPVWRRLSDRLQTLHDPTVRDGKYKQLIFDAKYWQFKSKACKNNHDTPLFRDMLNLHMTEYCVNYKDVLRELCIVTMRFKAMEIILTESNSTLNVVTNYIHRTRTRTQTTTLEEKEQRRLANEKEEEEEQLELGMNWWIADDYHDDDNDDNMEIIKEFDDFIKTI